MKIYIYLNNILHETFDFSFDNYKNLNLEDLEKIFKNKLKKDYKLKYFYVKKINKVKPLSKYFKFIVDLPYECNILLEYYK